MAVAILLHFPKKFQKANNTPKILSVPNSESQYATMLPIRRVLGFQIGTSYSSWHIGISNMPPTVGHAELNFSSESRTARIVPYNSVVGYDTTLSNAIRSGTIYVFLKMTYSTKRKV